jgi:hypothetical protein
MIKYSWHQRYALDRFDLEGPMGRLIGWIVGTPNKSVVDQRFIDNFGYTSYYHVKSENNEKIAWTWKIWWAERDENGYYKPDSITNGATYSKMDDAKLALQERFNINPGEVHTVKWHGNLTEYN